MVFEETVSNDKLFEALIKSMELAVVPASYVSDITGLSERRAKERLLMLDNVECVKIGSGWFFRPKK
jgi:hypothetical protein